MLGYRPEQLLTQFTLSIWCRANRFEHGEVSRHDPVLKHVFGFRLVRVPVLESECDFEFVRKAEHLHCLDP